MNATWRNMFRILTNGMATRSRDKWTYNFHVLCGLCLVLVVCLTCADGATTSSVKGFKEYNSCMDVKNNLGTNATDGEYIIYLKWKNNIGINVYCAFMQTSDKQPKAYISLRAGRFGNYASVYENNGSPTKCFDVFPRVLYSARGRTEFTRISIDLGSLSIDTGDFTFSNSTGTNKIRYGNAGDNHTSSSSCSPRGIFQIDLKGTPFTVSKQSIWTWTGSDASGANTTVGQAHIKDNTYIGCFRDTTERLLPAPVRHDDVFGQTVGKCVEHCRKNKFAFAGLEYGVECHCGNEYNNDLTPSSESFCDRPCSGNSSQICGGTWFISIYKTVVSQSLTGRCGGYPGKCYPASRDQPSQQRLGLTLMHDNHRCIRNPCKNEGRCIAVSASTFKCVCYPGYTGTRCERQNVTIVENGYNCPIGFQAEACKCAERACLGAKFQGDVCKTTTGNSRLVCRPSDPGHVILFNHESVGSINCPVGSELVSCSTWSDELLNSVFGQLYINRYLQECTASSSNAFVQARCKKYMCGCKNGGRCNRITGQCICRASYYGEKCETFDYCAYFEDTHNNTSPCASSGICTPIHKYEVTTYGGDKSGSRCQFPFDWGDQTFHTCVDDNKAGPPFACAGVFGQSYLGYRAFINLGAWSPGPRYTIAAWVSPEQFDTMRQTIVGGVSHCNDFGFNFNSGTFRGFLKLSNECTRDLDAGTPYAKTGTWYMVAITNNASHSNIYVNGELRESNTVLLNNIPTSEGFWIGGAKCCDMDFFTGKIKNVKVWNRALDVEDINRSMYNIGVSNSTQEALHDGLVGHWELAEINETVCDGDSAINHGGEDWIPKDGQIISGIHCNISRFVVPKGVTVSVLHYNGMSGGSVDISALEAVIDGYIDAVGAGYRGGETSVTPGEGGKQGESYLGEGDHDSVSVQNNRGGGGGGIGGRNMFDSKGRSGGGGGYGTAGHNGVKAVGDRTGLGSGGSIYGDEDVSFPYMGSGGGSGGNAMDLTTNPIGGRGGNGGGSVKLRAVRSIRMTGVISVAGEPGKGDIPTGASCMQCPDACDLKSPVRCLGNSTTACWDMSGPGGGGSGGTIYLSAQLVDIGHEKLWAMGGAGGAGGSHCCGGAGGQGRIRTDSIYHLKKGSVGENHGNVRHSVWNNNFYDYSQVGQQQIDYKTTQYGNEVYRGCFSDSPNGRTLGVPMPDTDVTRSKMTPDYCKQLCRQRSFMYSGTANGTLCFCDNHLDMSRKVGDAFCSNNNTMRCSGNPLWWCGGFTAIQVFGPPPRAPAVGYGVLSKCEPWCVTANANTDNPKWGICKMDMSDVGVAIWDIKCECPTGMTGTECDKTCHSWTYGNGCRRNCTCDRSNTAVCDSVDGSCQCRPGYQGTTCNETCTDEYYGEGCKFACTCHGNSVCDHVTGACICKGGWYGNNCNFPCAENTYGINCSNTCPSCNHGTCSPIDGHCECYPGYKLPLCAEKCERLTYGQDCLQRCDCNGSPCDPVSGNCICGPGYIGPRCEGQCPHGFWGQACKTVCDCEQGSGCDHITGECNCGPGYLGARCDIACPKGQFGRDCRYQSACIVNQTTFEDPVSGACDCLDGYEGGACQLHCRPGYYGRNCRDACKCKNGARCNSLNGSCTCAAGFTGSMCQTPCPQGYYGNGCQSVCSASCHGQCNIVDGSCNCQEGQKCQCPPNTAGISHRCNQACGCVNGHCDAHSATCICFLGWTGTKCDVPCTTDTDGVSCAGRCGRCTHGLCDQTGVCHCDTGFTGTSCDQPCTNKAFGYGCQFRCAACGPYSLPACDTVTGACVCSAGYVGALCDKPCPPGKYGLNCSKSCSCQNGGVCDNVSGACKCPSGYQGDKCDSRCAEGRWGVGCLKTCDCGPYGSSCSPEEGLCQCKPGFLGVKCRESCPIGSWGQGCESKCNCDVIGSVCSPIDGSCMCKSGYSGDACADVCKRGFWGRDCSQPCECNNRGTCNPFSGQCDCAPGYRGNNCDEQCDQDINWGKDCANMCSCSGADCDHRDGTCRCPPGKTGHHCEQECDANHFGFQCAQPCGCKNNAACNLVTGACRCQPGWSGTFCDEKCPAGYYGVDCSELCRVCWNGGTCDTFSGTCICGPQFSGETCNTSILVPAVYGATQQHHGEPASGINLSVGQFAAIMVGFVLLLVLMVVIAVIITRKLAVGRFGGTSGAIKFNEEELEHTHFEETPPMETPEAFQGFTNPVHDPTFDETDLDQKSVASEATSGVHSATMDTDEEDNNFFKDSAA